MGAVFCAVNEKKADILGQHYQSSFDLCYVSQANFTGLIQLQEGVGCQMAIRICYIATPRRIHHPSAWSVQKYKKILKCKNTGIQKYEDTKS